MKKLFISLLAFCMSISAFAQLMSSSSLIVTKESFPDVKPGWYSNIEAGYKLGLEDYSFVGLNYSLGYRFNKSLLLGLQAGFEYALDTEVSAIAPDAKLSPNAINVPVCAFARLYFPVNRILPFLEIDAGARLAPKKTATYNSKELEYSASGIIINPRIGLGYRISENNDLYVSAGYCLQSRAKVETISGTSIGFSNPLYSNVSVNIGLTF